MRSSPIDRVLDERLARLVERRSGLSLSGSRLPASLIAIQRRMAAAGARDAAEYRRVLEHDPAALEALVTSLTVGETYFYRHREQLELLRDVILPEVLSRRGRRHAVRAWSAGCATGEEAYSLATVLSQEGVEGTVLGTDVSRARVKRAKAGVYGSWSLRGVRPKELEALLEPSDEQFRVRPSLSRLVAFEPGNLVTGPPGRGRFDVVFCRNVLIYLTPGAVDRAAANLMASLAPDGWLVTSPSDPLLTPGPRLERVLTSHGIAYRRRARRVPHPRRGGQPRPLEPESADRVPKSAAAPATPEIGGRAELNRLDECISSIRDLADRGRTTEALACAETRVREHPASAELQYLAGLLRLGLGRPGDAVAAVDAALYLQPDLAVAHMLRAQATRRLGDMASCERSLRNARRLLVSLPASTAVPLADGETADALLAAVDAQLGLRPGRP